MKYVLYHKNCADGFTAAWVAWKWFAGECGLRWVLAYGGPLEECLGTYKDESGVVLDPDWEPDVIFAPVQYGEGLPRRVLEAGNDDEVYFVDFCPEFTEMTEIVNRAKRLVVLDHHKSREGDLRDLVAWIEPKTRENPLIPEGAFSAVGGIGNCEVELWYRIKQSGAPMAWDFWFPNEKIPELVRYVEDRDLWRWELEDSAEVNAYIRNQDYEFAAWDALHEEFRQSPEGIADIGASLLQRDRILVDQLIQAPVWIRLGLAAPVIPAVCAPVLQSEVGHALLERWPEAAFAACWRDQMSPDGDGTWERVWSLRARTGDAVDVSEVAKGFGGGGHRCAAGFRERGLWPDGRLRESEKEKVKSEK